MSEQTLAPTSRIFTKPFTLKPRLSEAEWDELLSQYEEKPHRVRGVDSHFFRLGVPVVDQSWHEGGVFGCPFTSQIQNIMTDISRLRFVPSCPEAGDLPPPEGITAVISDHAIIAYPTTQTSIQTAKAMFFPPVHGGTAGAVGSAIFVMEEGIYKVEGITIDNITDVTEDFARSEARATLGPHAKQLLWTVAERITYHSLKKDREEGGEEDENEGKYVPEDSYTLRKVIQGLS